MAVAYATVECAEAMERKVRRRTWWRTCGEDTVETSISVVSTVIMVNVVSTVIVFSVASVLIPAQRTVYIDEL